MLQVLLVPLVSAHLLLVDVAMAGPLLCVGVQWRRGDPLADRAALGLARLATLALLGGIATGAILLGIRWWTDDGAYFSALATIPASRVWFGLAELLFSLTCMAAYLGLWNRLRDWRWVHWLLPIAAASNLLLHFPALFAVVSVVSTRSELWGHALDRAGYQWLLVDPEVMSRVIHVWLAAFAVSGMALMAIASRVAGDQEDQVAAGALVQRGAWLGLIPSLAQLPSGLYLALQMPQTAREPLVGGDGLATSLFMLSLLLALLLIHNLAAIALGDRDPKQIHRSLVILLLVVLSMVGTRSRLQSQRLADRGQSSLGFSPRSTVTEFTADLHHAKVAFQYRQLLSPSVDCLLKNWNKHKRALLSCLARR